MLKKIAGCNNLVTMNSHNWTKSKAVLSLVRWEDKIKAQRRIEYP